MAQFRPPQTLKKVDIAAVRVKLRADHGPAPAGPALPGEVYRQAVEAVVRRRFGVPLPPSILPLVAEGLALRLSPETLADDLGRVFDLTDLAPSYWKRSS